MPDKTDKAVAAIHRMARHAGSEADDDPGESDDDVFRRAFEALWRHVEKRAKDDDTPSDWVPAEETRRAEVLREHGPRPLLMRRKRPRTILDMGGGQ